MTPHYITSALLLLVVCMLVAAGCITAIHNGQVSFEYGKNGRIVSHPILPTSPTLKQIPVQPSLYWIRIDPISDKKAGDFFTINSTTNLSAGDEILVQVFSANYHSHVKSDTSTFSGVLGHVNVIPGRNGINTISFIVNSSGHNPDKYVIFEEAVIENATGSALFNITPEKTL